MNSPNREIIAAEIWRLATRDGSQDLTDTVIEFPEDFADRIGVTRRTVENAFRAFEKAGALTWYRKGAFGARRPHWPVSPNPDHQMWSAMALQSPVAVSGGAL